MGADAGIYSLIRPQAPAEGPLDQYGKMVSLKSLMGNEQLNEMQRTKLARDMMREENFQKVFEGATPEQMSAPDFLQKVMAADPMRGIALQKSQLEQQKTQADLFKTKLETGAKALELHRDQLVNVNDPQAAAAWVKSAYSDPTLAPLAAHGGTLEQALSRIPTDPAGFQQWKDKNSVGAAKLVELSQQRSEHQLNREVTTRGQDLSRQSSLAHDATLRRGQDLVDARQGSFSPQSGNLLAALAEKGVSIPAGFRSRQQMTATLDSLISRNPGKSPDEIAEMLKSGQIGFGAEKKETQTAAAVAGRVGVAGEEIAQFAPLVEEASKNVARGQFVPISKLMQMGETSISDPNLKRLKVYINSTLNAYDQLASRGGTDKDKRAEAHALLTTAESHEALMAGLDAFKKEVVAAQRAADIASRPRSEREAARKEGAPASRETRSDATSKPSGVDVSKLSDAELLRELGIKR